MSFSPYYLVFFDVFLAQFPSGQLCWWYTMGVASDITRRYNITTDFLILGFLKSFCSPFNNVFLFLTMCFVDIFVGTRFYKSAFWCVVVCYSGLCLMQQKFLCWGVRATLTYVFLHIGKYVLVRICAGLIS